MLRNDGDDAERAVLWPLLRELLEVPESLDQGRDARGVRGVRGVEVPESEARGVEVVERGDSSLLSADTRAAAISMAKALAAACAEACWFWFW